MKNLVFLVLDKSLSIVAALILKSFSLALKFSLISPYFSNTSHNDANARGIIYFS